jgi:hypothetical protein
MQLYKLKFPPNSDLEITNLVAIEDDHIYFNVLYTQPFYYNYKTMIWGRSDVIFYNVMDSRYKDFEKFDSLTYNSDEDDVSSENCVEKTYLSNGYYYTKEYVEYIEFNGFTRTSYHTYMFTLMHLDKSEYDGIRFRGFFSSDYKTYYDGVDIRKLDGTSICTFRLKDSRLPANDIEYIYNNGVLVTKSHEYLNIYLAWDKSLARLFVDDKYYKSMIFALLCNKYNKRHNFKVFIPKYVLLYIFDL